jgi:undecaprenyl-diphosphatase
LRSRQTLAVILASLAVVAALAIRVTRTTTPWLDARIIEHVPPGNDPNWLAHLCNGFILAGMGFGALVGTLVFVVLVARRQPRLALFWLSSFAGVAVLDVALKPIFERPPIGDLSNGYSFPSGNAMGSMALLAGGALLSPGTRRALYLFGGAIVLVYGAALVYISWHYPTDVIAGWLLALAWVGLLDLTIRPRDDLRPAPGPSGREPARSRAGSD